MSSYVYMKLLESTPQRYDRGIRMLSRGAIDGVYRRIAERVARPGVQVLDIGCGTGNVALACAARGAHVVGIDKNAGMLEVARQKGADSDCADRLEWLELGAMEIEDRFPERSLDAAVSCLAFSELAYDEQDYVLSTVRSRLRPGGTLVVADEVAPTGRAARAWWQIRRAPRAWLTWVRTQTTTRPVDGLEQRLASAGLIEVRSERLAGDFLLVEGSTAEAAP